MLYRLITIFLILIAPTSGFANGTFLTLDEAWRLMLDYDPALKASGQVLNEKQGEKLSALSPFLPQVKGNIKLRHYTNEEGFVWDSGSFGLGILPFPATEKTVPTYEVGVEQMLFDSGKYIAGYKASTYGVEAAKHQIFADRQNRAFDLLNAYTDCYLAQKKLDVKESAASAFSEHSRVAGLRYKQDLVTKTDMLSAEVEAAKGRIDVIEAKDNVEVARQKLATLIGEPPGNVETPKVPHPPEYVESPSERPEIKAKAAEMNANRLIAKKEGLSYLPDLFARADTAYIDDFYRLNKTQVTIWAGIRIPVFDGMYHWGKRQTAKALSRRNRFEKEAMYNLYTVELKDALLAWKRSDKEIAVATKNRRRTSENLRDAKLNYAEGMVSAIEVRDAIKLSSEAELTYHQAVCNKEKAAARLRQAAGISILESGGYDAKQGK